MPLDFSRFKTPLFWLEALGILILVVLLLWGINSYISSSLMCKSCHIIKPYYLSWQKSTHSDISCLQCHTRLGFKNMILYRFSSLKNFVTYYTTGKLKKRIYRLPSQICTNCHVLERKVTPRGDLIIPHAKHAQIEGVICLDCHKNLVHGKGGRKNAPVMETCYNCHGKKFRGKEVTDKCEICHSEKAPPSNHFNPLWSEQHGMVALRDQRGCFRCHAKPREFCFECHQKRPPSHTEVWNFKHKNLARITKEACIVCHGASYCLKCHGKSGKPVHPSNWLKIHPNVAKSQGIAPCYECHGKKHCASCHVGEKI